MSAEDIRRHAAAAEEPLPEDLDDGFWKDCGVVPLGQRNGEYMFIGASGEFRIIGARDLISPGHLLSLFNGDKRAIAREWPKNNNEGKPTGDFIAKNAAAALMRRCAQMPLWDHDTPMRGVGVYAAGDGLVVHVGDRLIVANPGKRPRRLQSGIHWDGAIYPAAPPIEPPAKEAADAQEAARLLGFIKLWTFAEPIAPKMIIGWVGAAMFGAAPGWRVHVLLKGERGTGKTALTELAAAALGPQARQANDFTEAGLRQLLSGEGRALLLDEAEDDAERNRVEQVIVFIRRTAGGTGADVVRGTAGGKYQKFIVACSAWLSAINAPALLPQDRSRIFDVEVGKLKNENRQHAIEAIRSTAEASPRLRARAIAGWQRFGENLAIYRDELMAAGCDPRQADKFGTLLASGEMMLADVTIERAEAEGEVAELAPVIAAMIAEDSEDSDAGQCLATLMTRQIEHWKGGSKSTIGRLVQSGLEDGGAEQRRALLVYGMRLSRVKGGEWGLFVANRHEGLKTIFQNTRWRNGAWRTSLMRLEGTTAAKKPVRFDGFQSRAILIAQRHLPVPLPPQAVDESNNGDGDDPI